MKSLAALALASLAGCMVACSRPDAMSPEQQAAAFESMTADAAREGVLRARTLKDLAGAANVSVYSGAELNQDVPASKNSSSVQFGMLIDGRAQDVIHYYEGELGSEYAGLSPDEGDIFGHTAGHDVHLHIRSSEDQVSVLVESAVDPDAKAPVDESAQSQPAANVPAPESKEADTTPGPAENSQQATGKATGLPSAPDQPLAEGQTGAKSSAAGSGIGGGPDSQG